MYRKGEEADTLPVDNNSNKKPGSSPGAHHVAPTPNAELYWNVKCFLLYHVLFPLFSKIWRTAREHPPPIRQKPLEILVLGPSHCGIDALAASLKVLGYDEPYNALSSADDTAAWSGLVARKLACRLPGQLYAPMIPGCGAELRRTFEPLLASSSVVMGQAAAVFGPELLRAYPDAKVILNRAPGSVEAWVEATRDEVECRQGWWSWACGLVSPGRFWGRQLWELLFLAQFYGPGDWGRRRWYLQHFGQMRALVTAGRCLEWCEADGWKPLCEFLEKPVPSVRFPGASDQPDSVGGTGSNLPRTGYARSIFLGLALILATFLIGLIVGIMVAERRLSLREAYGWYLSGIEEQWRQQKFGIQSVLS